MSEPPKEKDHWFRDMLIYGPMTGLLPVLVIGILAALLLPALSKAKAKAKNRVIVYAAQDQVYAEPILREFEKETGINVRAIYDSEAVKTVGLANRLLAERSHPQCDVFWGNEEMRTRQLAAQGVFRETNGWAAFGYRSRRIVINTNFVSLESAPASGAVSRAPRETFATGATETNQSANHVIPLVDGASARTREGARAPQSLLELTNETWRGKVALAFPQFGTTTTHFHALRQLWGEERWLAWCRALAANKPFIVDGNSVVVKLVARGEGWIGLTDSDDIAAEQREGAPILALPLTGEVLLIPNTVAVVRNAPHPNNAEKLFQFLQRRDVVGQLVAAHALESTEAGRRRGDESQTEKRSETPHVVSYGEIESPALQPDWDLLLRDLETTTKQLNEIFLR
ncbi:MAG: substrate-binding domain-containing protein [Verrucomicrobia bacterium]|nr:substrate-binding domain-containing protein [Verrucomicrobiota bacterium]